MTTLTVHSPDPSDRAVTKRVITIMQKLSYTSMVLTICATASAPRAAMPGVMTA